MLNVNAQIFSQQNTFTNIACKYQLFFSLLSVLIQPSVCPQASPRRHDPAASPTAGGGAPPAGTRVPAPCTTTRDILPAQQ